MEQLFPASKVTISVSKYLVSCLSLKLRLFREFFQESHLSFLSKSTISAPSLLTITETCHDLLRYIVLGSEYRFNQFFFPEY